MLEKGGGGRGAGERNLIFCIKNDRFPNGENPLRIFEDPQRLAKDLCTQRRSFSVATQLSFGHLFDKCLISLMASGLKQANQIFRTSAKK